MNLFVTLLTMIPAPTLLGTVLMAHNYKFHNADIDCNTGENCQLGCHCANNDPCPTFPDHCTGGCAANWVGPRCDSCADGWTGDKCDQRKMSHLYSVYVV